MDPIFTYVVQVRAIEDYPSKGQKAKPDFLSFSRGAIFSVQRMSLDNLYYYCEKKVTVQSHIRAQAL